MLFLAINQKPIHNQSPNRIIRKNFPENSKRAIKVRIVEGTFHPIAARYFFLAYKCHDRRIQPNVPIGISAKTPIARKVAPILPESDTIDPIRTRHSSMGIHKIAPSDIGNKYKKTVVFVENFTVSPAQGMPQLLTTIYGFIELVRPERFELPTPWFVARYSIQLSYGRTSYLAERVGFEPTMKLLAPYSLSRGAPSAARPPLLKIAISILNRPSWPSVVMLLDAPLPDFLSGVRRAKAALLLFPAHPPLLSFN